MPQPPQKTDLTITPVPRKPSEWSPRPIPTRGIGRSTQDPVTPTLRQLAERAARRATLVQEVPDELPAFTSAQTESLEEPEEYDDGRPDPNEADHTSRGEDVSSPA